MIYNKLFPWQKKIIDSFKTKQDFGLFLDMGIGKTVISLAFAEANNCTKILIIAPNSKATESDSVDGSWLQWAEQSDIKYQLLDKHSNISASDASKPELLLVNYESIFKKHRKKKNEIEIEDKSLQLKQQILDFIEHCGSENVAMIIDESHKMKTLSSSTTKSIFKIKEYLCFAHANVHCYVLSGTPFSHGYIDLYSQLKFLGLPMTKTEFKRQFCITGHVAGLYDWQQPITGYQNIPQLFDLIHEYGLTIESKEVEDLPEQIFIDKVVPVSKEFKLETFEQMLGTDINNEIINRHISKTDIDDYCDALGIDSIDFNVKKKVNNPFYRNVAFPNLSWIADTIGTFWLRTRQISIGFQGSDANNKWFNSSRLNMLRQFMSDNYDNYVIFYNYTPELEVLYPMLTDLGYNVDVYCGPVKSLYYYDTYCKDIKDEKMYSKKNVILANFASGSEGKNWQAYNKCIIFSLPIYKDYAQAIKRIHRHGQKNTVIYYRFYQDNWLEKNMLKALNEQIDYSNDLFEADLKRVNQIMAANN